MLRTQIDDIIELALENNGITTFKEIEQKLNIPAHAVEHLIRTLEKNNVIVETIYPINPFSLSGFKVIGSLLPNPEEQSPPKGTVIEKYKIGDESEHIASEVQIIENMKEERKVYFVKKETISPYTKIYLDYLQDHIALELPAETTQMSDEEKRQTVYLQQCELTEKHLLDVESDKHKVRTLCGIIRSNMFGFGDIDILLNDDWLEEIAINQAMYPVLVYHRKHGWLKTNIQIQTEEQISNYSAQIARRIGKQISVLTPILDAHLVGGDRVNATMPPISIKGNTLTIRRFARNPWTIIHFINEKVKSLSPQMAAMIWQAMHYELNVIVAGGTASGKTSMLNALAMFIPPYQRIISIEDTREISFSSCHWNWIPMVVRLANPEGLGGVTMLDLMINALRMRPDRILVGEIRRSAEARTLFEAMHTGHSVYSTLHADTGMQVVKRLIEPPIKVPPSEIEAVNLVLVQYRNRRLNVRRTLEISEIVSSGGVPDINKSYIWRARNDNFEFAKPPNKYVQALNAHTGMTEKEIFEDQKKKANILEWMDRHEWREIEQVGKMIKRYYANEDSLYNAVEKDISPAKVL